MALLSNLYTVGINVIVKEFCRQPSIFPTTDGNFEVKLSLMYVMETKLILKLSEGQFPNNVIEG